MEMVVVIFAKQREVGIAEEEPQLQLMCVMKFVVTVEEYSSSVMMEIQKVAMGAHLRVQQRQDTLALEEV